MSTVTNEGAEVPSSSAGPASARSSPGRTLRLVLGSLGVLAGVGLAAAAVAGIVGLETQRDATGYFVTHTHHYQTTSYALSTERLDVTGITGMLEAGLLRLRIAATSSSVAKPIFVGIARSADINDYLNRVEHDELRGIGFDPFHIDYRRAGAGAPAAPPATQTFWQIRAQGTGTQKISWPVARGHWIAVVMNADGSRNVGVDAQLATRLSGAWWFVAASVALAALALLGGVLLLRSGTRTRGGRPAPATDRGLT